LETLVATYGKDFDAAKAGHEKWVKFVTETIGITKVVQQHKMPDKSKEVVVRVNAMKISFHALMKVLYNYAGEQTIKITPNRKLPHELHIELSYPNKNGGSCLYDFNKMEAWGITPKWFSILQELKAEIQDQRETIDEENASSGQCKRL